MYNEAKFDRLSEALTSAGIEWMRPDNYTLHILCGESIIHTFDLNLLVEGIPDHAFEDFAGRVNNMVKAYKEQINDGGSTSEGGEGDLRDDVRGGGSTSEIPVRGQELRGPLPEARETDGDSLRDLPTA